LAFGFQLSALSLSDPLFLLIGTGVKNFKIICKSCGKVRIGGDKRDRRVLVNTDPAKNQYFKKVVS
jgi:hypothetical protein